MARKDITDEQIIEACSSGQTMNTCAGKLGMAFMTFKRRAERLGVYIPNPGRKGMERNPEEFKKMTIPLEDIITGKFDGHYLSSRLRKRLIKEGIKEEKCEKCGLENWNGKSLPFELHHIDGNRINNKLENLTILCPNCHSQTPNHSIRK
jgi:hypothetical protein